MPTDNPQSFAAPYDSTTKVMSVVICLLLAVIAVITQSAIVVLVGVAILFFAFAFSPRSYSIQNRSIVVKRLIGNVTIPLDGIREVRIATDDDLRGAYRLWANGGLFGYYGLFSTLKLGNCRWYMTDRKKAVIVVTENNTALLQPWRRERLSGGDPDDTTCASDLADHAIQRFAALPSKSPKSGRRRNRRRGPWRCRLRLFVFAGATERRLDTDISHHSRPLLPRHCQCSERRCGAYSSGRDFRELRMATN